MRVPLLGWSMFCATLQMAGLARYVREADAALPLAVYAVNMAMRLSTIAFLLLLGASVVLRARPTGKARGLQPRITAFAGAFLVYAIPFFPRRELASLISFARRPDMSWSCAPALDCFTTPGTPRLRPAIGLALE